MYHVQQHSHILPTRAVPKSCRKGNAWIGPGACSQAGEGLYGICMSIQSALLETYRHGKMH